MRAQLCGSETSASEVADVLNAIGVRPEIMGMPTFVALTNDRSVIVWVPNGGWKAAGRNSESAGHSRPP